jgi:predicted transcriptional regulator
MRRSSQLPRASYYDHCSRFPGLKEVAMPTIGRRKGALEQEVLAALAAAGRPLTAAEVLADLGDGLAYTTVMTTLSRLHAKGALTRQHSGRAYAYSLDGGDAASVRASVTAHRMRRLLEAGSDRAGVLARFVAELPPEDEQLLAALLAATTRAGEPA